MDEIKPSTQAFSKLCFNIQTTNVNIMEKMLIHMLMKTNMLYDG